ncbi:MAG: transcriptional regulator, TraR/DksA family [Pedosphaera sp.]|nr:transcriptional regulator, TraR/DksA family [Pedosphaera sp.]
MEKKKNHGPKSAPSGRRLKATSQDVLTPVRPRPRINPKWAHHYQHLSDLRDYFLRQKGTLTQDANEEQPTYSEHMADAGTDSYDRDFALSMLSSDQNALYEIDEAIKRVENGNYGICELTGKPIPIRRLDAIPWARYTVEAEKQLEERGVINHARLGNLGSLTSGGEGEEEEAETESGEENH